MQKTLLLFFIFFFSFQSSSYSDEFSDLLNFEIEGISVGDSALDFFSENEIKQSMTQLHLMNKKREKFRTSEIFSNKFKVYQAIQISFKKNDKKYIIHHIAGLKGYPNNIKQCYSDKEDLAEVIKGLFPNEKKEEIKGIHPGDPSGKSVFSKLLVTFDKKLPSSLLLVECIDYAKSTNWLDHLRVDAATKEFNETQY